MDHNKTRPQSDAERYCHKDPEKERFYEIFFLMCQKYGVRWTNATQEEQSFIAEATKFAYEKDRSERSELH